MKWVQLGQLEAGTLFLTRNGCCGRVRPVAGARSGMILVDGMLGPQLSKKVPVFPINPATLAADLAELEGLRLIFEDRREFNQAEAQQEQAKERERVAEYLLSLRAKQDGDEIHMEGPFRLSNKTIEGCANRVRNLGPAPFPQRCDALIAENERLKAELASMKRVRLPRRGSGYAEVHADIGAYIHFINITSDPITVRFCMEALS